MMEYLEMRGAVKLKADAEQAVVSSVLDKLRETEFVDAGYIDIRRSGPFLRIQGEGLIGESYSLRQALGRLQDQLSAASMIGVTSASWETLVILKHREPSPALRLEPMELLAPAQ